jgi:hypothetical protein
MTGTEPHAWETGLMDTMTYVGLDVHKATVAVAPMSQTSPPTTRGRAHARARGQYPEVLCGRIPS